jgi:lysozyme family protein
MAEIKQALTKLFGVEGGYVNDPDDAGGETKFGICKRSYPHVDIKNLTLSEAADIYQKDFWGFLRLSEIRNQTIAEEIFDTAVNCGAVTAAKIAQEAVNLTNYPEPDIAVDGKIGSASVTAINFHKSLPAYYKALNGLQFVRYMGIVKNNPKQEKYFRGWLKRVFESTV